MKRRLTAIRTCGIAFLPLALALLLCSCARQPRLSRQQILDQFTSAARQKCGWTVEETRKRVLCYWVLTSKHRPLLAVVRFIYVAKQVDPIISFNSLSTDDYSPPPTPRSTEEHWYQWPFSCAYNYDSQQRAWVGQIQYSDGGFDLFAADGFRIHQGTLEEFLAQESTAAAEAVEGEGISIEFVMLRKQQDISGTQQETIDAYVDSGESYSVPVPGPSSIEQFRLRNKRFLTRAGP